MSGIKSLSGGMVDVNKLDTVLGSMGMSLTEEELKDLTQNLPENVDRKVDLKQVMDAVKSFTGEKVDINNLENLLRNMGIELADTEYTKLVKARPLSDDDKIFQNRLREVLKSLKDGKIYTNDLSAILDNMGVKISNKDLKALTKNFPADVFCESF
ncbi:uncharacterized protein LOC102154635 isoform X5 [Canis lupus familiaris]|uniref:uncharacterized protein LOC102154635 isoform X5 n=1 Tax=Canis lupus familiaris TaxID=9615 RepID=UPI0006B3C5F8|nr:uncharacterized protein LOC102154635 isoform X5 [Canis lupus familiaris]|eukprot:XP_022278509.1 uncharacterized protein LOC102154635 isoform X4 [Canis lupus familiaris]